MSQTLSPFRKDSDTSNFSVGPSVTTTNNLWFNASATPKFTYSNHEINEQKQNEANEQNLMQIEKALSCNDLRQNSLERAVRRLNLNPRRSSIKLPTLPPTPPTPPTPPANSTQNLPTESTSQSSIPKPIQSKTRCRPLMLFNSQQSSTRMIRSWWPVLSVILVSFVIALIAMGIENDDLVLICSPVMNFSTTSKELQNRVYGQNDAVTKLTNYLQTRKNGFEVVAIVGGTGVGKSHTANIIRQVTEDDFVALEYVPPLLDKEKNAYKNLAACKCNVVVIDNVQTRNIGEAARFTRDLRQLARHYCVLTMVLINTQVINDQMEKSLDLKKSLLLVESLFLQEQIDVKVFGYEALENEILDHCILEAADYSNVTLSSRDVELIRKHLVTMQSGCKGAYAKVQVLEKH